MNPLEKLKDKLKVKPELKEREQEKVEVVLKLEEPTITIREEIDKNYKDVIITHRGCFHCEACYDTSKI